MYGNISPRRATPRQLPPIDDSKIYHIEERLKRQEDTTRALIDRALRIKEDIVNTQDFTRGTFSDERKNRQLLEEHIRVITAVCKKLNSDIEAIDSQLSEKNYQTTQLEYKMRDMDASNSSYNKDVQFKISRNDNTLTKLESDNINLIGTIKDLQSQFFEFNRSVMGRMHDIENRIGELNSKFDSVLSEQTMVLKNVEGDTVKQLQLLDGKTRTMLEDVRSQITMLKSNHETELARLESRLLHKVDEISKSNDKYERLDRKLDEHTAITNKKYVKFEDDFQRGLTKLNGSVDKLENKVYRGLDDKYGKTLMDYDRMKRDLKAGFENVQDSISTLQKVVDGKIRLSEDKLEKEIEKIRKMVVLM